METKPDQTLRTKQRDNPKLKIGGSIKRPKFYLYKEKKDR